MQFTDEELVRRIKLIMKEIKGFPTDSQEVRLDQPPSLREVPYWASLLEQIEAWHGSLESFLRVYVPSDYLSRNRVRFPSPEQDETTTQMLEQSRLLIRDRAGSGKTAPVIKTKFALEQLVLNGGRVNFVTVCPNFVMSSWQAKLNQYLIARPNILLITSANRREAIRQFAEGTAAGSLDATLVSYDALFRHTDGNAIDELSSEIGRVIGRRGRIVDEQITLADALLASLEISQNPFMLVLDESQNARNPEALRSRAVRKMALAADYLYAVTGTPFPDSLDDIGEIASLLDHETYPTAEQFNRTYQGDPRLIRLFLRRFSKEPVIGVSDIEGVPEVKIHEPHWLGMSADEQALYWGVLDYREINMGTKFALMRLAAVDGSLLLPENYSGSQLGESLEKFFEENPELRETALRIQSTKYLALDKLVEDAVSRGEKIVVWSKLREGITRALERRYEKFGSCRIDGTVSAEPGTRRYSDRDIVRLTFQTDPDTKVLVATIDSLREGQDLHAANNTAFIMRDFSPGITDQVIGRQARRGQQRVVNVYSFLMQGSIEQGIYELEQEKREGIREAEEGFELTDEQRQALDRKKPAIKQTTIRRYLMNAGSHVRFMSGHMLNKGALLNQRYLSEGENFRIYAQAYNYLWNFSYSAHTARLIAQLINEIEEKEGVLERIIDLGSGPATVSRVLRRPTFCVDINPAQLEIGRRECADLGIDIETQVGNIEQLDGIKSSDFDLGILSLVLHYGHCQDGGRKQMVLETNRVVRNGGYAIITLPSKIVQGEGREKLESGLEILGLAPISERTGIVHAIDGKERDYEVYVAVCKKIHGNSDELVEDGRYDCCFILNPDFSYREFGREKRETGKSGIQGYRKEICTMFEFENGDVVKPVRDVRVIRAIDEARQRTPQEIVSILDRHMSRRSK